MRKLVFSDGSPFARKVRIILAEKRLEFEADIVTDYLRTSDSLKEHNPLLQVPTLYDRGRAIWGSDLILHYPETPSNGALPPLSPTLARLDMYWDDMLTLTTIDSMADAIVNYRLMIAGGPEFKNTFMERQIGRVPSALDWLEQRCTREGFWPGTFSVMDINLMCPLIYGEVRARPDFS
jgi:glutathione S-transferase